LMVWVKLLHHLSNNQLQVMMITYCSFFQWLYGWRGTRLVDWVLIHGSRPYCTGISSMYSFQLLALGVLELVQWCGLLWTLHHHISNCAGLGPRRLWSSEHIHIPIFSNLEDIYSIFCIYYQYLFGCTPSSDNKASIHPTLGITPSVAKVPGTTIVLGWLGVGGFWMTASSPPWDGARVLLSKTSQWSTTCSSYILHSWTILGNKTHWCQTRGCSSSSSSSMRSSTCWSPVIHEY
jgi:hypothetical protein